MTAHEMVAKARNLPGVSQAGLKLVELLDENSDHHRDAVSLITGDVLLTAKLLRACNSSALGLRERVSSVDQAVLLLGYSRVLNMVMSLVYGPAMTCPLPCYGLESNGLWRHAFATASAAEQLVKRGLYNDCDASVAFTAGLLHDIGKIVMSQVVAQAQPAIEKHMQGEGLRNVQAEREVLGTDHAEVGACLLHIWRLPEWIVEAAANHHKAFTGPRIQLSALVSLADHVAHLAEPDADPQALAAEWNGQTLIEAFEFSRSDLEAVIGAVRESESQCQQILAL